MSSILVEPTRTTPGDAYAGCLGSPRPADEDEHRQWPSRSVAPLSWDTLVLDPEVVKLLKRDFDSFWDREAWFKAANHPFRRGYLLYGPPGNGKTSAIRAMMTSQRLSGYTIRLFDPDLNDGDLEAMFAEAGRL